MFSIIPQKGLVSEMMDLIILIALMIPMLLMLLVPIVILATFREGLRDLGFSDKEMTIW